MFSSDKHTVVNERDLFSCYVMTEIDMQSRLDKNPVLFKLIFDNDNLLKLFKNGNEFKFKKIFIESLIQDVITWSWTYYNDVGYGGKMGIVILTEKMFDKRISKKFIDLDMSNAKCCIFGDTLKIMF